MAMLSVSDEYHACCLFVAVFTGAGAPGRTVLRTDGVLLGKYDIIKNK